MTERAPPVDDRLQSPAVVQAMLAAIVECSDDAIVSKSLEGIVRTWNDGAQRIFGWAPEEVIGKPINIIIPPDRQDEEPHILQRIRSGERVEHFETVRMRKDGTLIDVSVTISPVRDETGTIIGASKIARNVTDQKRAQEKLEEAKELAERASRAKDEFIGALSHELRTPLTPVLAEVSHIEMHGNLDPEMRESMAMIRRNVETEARLVDDLLDVTRIARGKVRLHFEALDAHQAIRAALAMVQSNIDEKSLTLAISLRARRHHIWADAGRLQQIMLNLLSNAVKFTPENGSISVTTSNENGKGDQELVIEVRDSGMGISAEMLPRLFKPFEQAPESRRYGGLGLGLSIVKSLIDMHHATISARSEGQNRGSSFTLRLQAVGQAAVDESSMSQQPATKSPCRILLVEDHPDTRHVLERLLRGFGYSVFSAASVREALAIAQKNPVDLVLSDIGLPDGTGIDVLSVLRRDGPIKGIALSGFGQEEDVARSREAGFENHLVKPVNFLALREAIHRATS